MVDSRQEHIKLGTYPPEQVYKVLQTSPQGLSSQEVKERQATYGPLIVGWWLYRHAFS